MPSLFKPNNPIPVSSFLPPFLSLPLMSFPVWAGVPLVCNTLLPWVLTLITEGTVCYVSSHQRGNQNIWHLGFWLGAGFAVLECIWWPALSVSTVFSCLCWTNPIEGVQPNSRVMSPDASCVSQVAVELVFSADLTPWCGQTLLSFGLS